MRSETLAPVAPLFLLSLGCNPVKNWIRWTLHIIQS
jgi:hypothetical protein